MKTNQEKFDVVVIGGGPAGMMAAARAAELGANVVLLEKNKSLGKKLLITGKGRCNITQAQNDSRKFIQEIGPQGKFLFSCLAACGPEKVVSFFEKNSLPTKMERGGRIFPVSDRAQDVLNVLNKYLSQGQVKVLLGKKVQGFETQNGKISGVKLQDKKVLGRNFILCTGGKSYPATGSTGDGYQWVQDLGHKIVLPRPALVPLKTKENWSHELAGLSLKNIRLSVFKNKKKQFDRFGEMLFTHSGLSGPIVLELSKQIGELLSSGPVFLEIDLKPALDFPQLDKRLQRDFEKNLNKNFQNYLPDLVPQKLIEKISYLAQIDPQRKVHSITKEERKNLVRLLKGLPLTVEGLLGFNAAIITSGGVALKEVDSKTMRSKIVPNLFLAGEILDLDGPTGGYNLQICWSTGYAAGTFAAHQKS